MTEKNSAFAYVAVKAEFFFAFFHHIVGVKGVLRHVAM